jgi:GntR family transcriptional regulator/MocR family aminotransferase
MTIQWAGLGPGILLRLDRGLREPIGSQLQRELREAIRSGRLAAGERLPSSRVLARELGISRGLALECYEQLQAEGYLVARLGSATRVAEGAHVAPEPAPKIVPATRLSVDFRPGVPDLASFPRRDWIWAMGEAARGAPRSALGYGEPRGSIVLREVLAAYLRRVRGAAAHPHEMVICSGFAQGLNLVLRALVRAGVHRVAFEDPGDPENYSIATRAGVKAIPIRVDANGMDVEALSASDARAVLLTPAHQSPTGVVLAAERRRALLAWSSQREATIIEDDYDAEFRYDRQPVGQIQGLAPDRVVALSSVSKTLAPALRIGWIVCPAKLAEVIATDKHLDDRGSPALDQIALARLIESGRYDRHLRHMRALYEGRREALKNSLARLAPDVELGGLAAGFHAVARLPKTIQERAVVLSARARTIGLYGMSRYRSTGETRPPELVIGFGHLSEKAIERGIAAVADLIQAKHRG